MGSSVTNYQYLKYWVLFWSSEFKEDIEKLQKIQRKNKYIRARYYYYVHVQRLEDNIQGKKSIYTIFKNPMGTWLLYIDTLKEIRCEKRDYSQKGSTRKKGLKLKNKLLDYQLACFLWSWRNYTLGQFSQGSIISPLP